MKVQFHSLRIAAFVLALTTFGASAALADTPANPPSLQQTGAGVSAANGAQHEERTASSDKVNATRSAPMQVSTVSNEPNWMGFEYTSK